MDDVMETLPKSENANTIRPSYPFMVIWLKTNNLANN